MSKRVRAKKLAGDEPIEQLRDLCFNIFGHAFGHPNEHRSEVVLITANRVSSTPYKKALESLKKEGAPGSRPSFQLTERETSLPDVGLFHYLLVGWAPQDLAAEHSRMSKEVVKQQPIGVKRPKTIITWDDTRPPYMVVTPVMDHEPDAVKLYALLRFREGLCTPYNIGQKDVFYLPQYRDNTTSKERGPAWNRMILKVSVRPQGRPSEKQAKNGKARDATKLVIEPNRSLSNEILCLFRGFEHSEHVWFLSELAQLLERVDEDLARAPQTSALKEFIEMDGPEFNQKSAEALISEIVELRPNENLEGLIIARVLQLYKALRQSGILLEYRFLEPFIIEGVFRLQHEDGDSLGNDQMIDIVKETVATVERVLGKSKSRKTNNDNSLLYTIRRKLMEMVDAATFFDEKPKDVAGDKGMESTIADI